MSRFNSRLLVSLHARGHGILTEICILTGVEAITSILDKMCERDNKTAKLLRSLERADASTPDRNTSPCSTSEAKRKRAKERQAKLLKQFASKQRIFEAQMETEDLVVTEVSLDSGPWGVS